MFIYIQILLLLTQGFI